MVILSGSLTSTNPSTGDCDVSSGGTQSCLIYIDTGSDLSRVEGSFVGTSNLTGVLQFGGTFGSDVSLITINNTNIKGVGSGFGIYSSAGYTPGLTVSNVNVSNFNANIFLSAAGRNKLLKNITISNAFSIGFVDSINGWYSKYVNITLINNGSIGFSSIPWNSVLQNIIISNNGGTGIDDFSSSSVFSNIMASGNGGSGIMTQSSFGVIKNITSVNNAGTGVLISSSGGNIAISNVLSSNNAKGIEVGDDNLSFSNVLVSNNTTGIEFVSSTTGGVFKNKLVLGSNATNCLYTLAGANPGLTGADCDNQGASSATKTLGASAVGYFQGKVLSESVNTHSTAFSVASSIADWLNFQNPFRLWGIETAGDVLLGSKGKCSGGGTCRVWDYRLLNTATEAYNANGIFVNGATCPASVQGDVTDLYIGTPHLVNAMEIMFDRKGNDNSLCESNEECIYSPHIGYYQGEGDYSSNTCLFVNGSGSNPVVGVKMYSYPNP